MDPCLPPGLWGEVGGNWARRLITFTGSRLTDPLRFRVGLFRPIDARRRRKTAIVGRKSRPTGTFTQLATVVVVTFIRSKATGHTSSVVSYGPASWLLKWGGVQNNYYA